MPEKKIMIKLCSRMTFEPGYHRTDQNNGGQFGTLSGSLRKPFWKIIGQKSPEIYLGPKSFRTIFEKRTPVNSLGARF